MNVTRTLTFGAVGAGLAALVAGAVTSGTRPVTDVASVTRPAVDAHGAALAAEVARLRARLRPTGVPQQPARNLFEFGAARSRQERSIDGSSPRTSEAPTVAAPALPPFTLIGLAEDSAADGPIRTAILSAFGDVLLVREGDSVTGRYRVARITADVVELMDAGDGTTLRLTLK